MLKLVIPALFVLCCSCNDIASNNDVKQLTQLGAVTDKTEAITDSLEDLADKMYDDAEKNTESPVVITMGGWIADKDLNTIKVVSIINKMSRVITGVKLVYSMKMGKSRENRDMGKFKLTIKPGKKGILRIKAGKFGVSDAIIESPSRFSLILDEKIYASVVYFSDGTTESGVVPTE